MGDVVDDLDLYDDLFIVARNDLDDPVGRGLDPAMVKLAKLALLTEDRVSELETRLASRPRRRPWRRSR